MHTIDKRKKEINNMKICYSDQEPVIGANSIFLAGPTRRNSRFKDSWRNSSSMILEEYGFNGILYVPEIYEDRKFDDEQLDKQVIWEWTCLDAADVIVFWIPRKLPDMPGFTTNVEFGIYTEKKPNQIVYGHTKEAEKMGYLDRRYKAVTGMEPCMTMEETMIMALKKLEEINKQKS